MRFLSLCSGIEAASIAFLPLGWTCAAVAEIENFPCRVLKHHYPEVPNLGNVDEITEEQVRALGPVDVTIFGFPCQDLSVAGKRKGFENADGTKTRSGLFYKCSQISEWSRSRFIVAENVPGLFSSNGGRDFASVVGELAGTKMHVPGDGWRTSGVALGSKGLVEWFVLDAQYSHLAQRRERVFFVRDSGNWADRPPLFLEPTRLRWDSPPSRATGKGITHELAPCLGASGRGFDRTGDTRGQDAVVATSTGRIDYESETMVITQPLRQSPYCDSASHEGGLIAHSLRAEGFDASEDGTGRGTPLTVTGTLTSNGDAHSGFKDEHGIIAFQPRVGRNGRGDMGDKVNALQAQSGGTDATPCVAFSENQRAEVLCSDTAPTLKSGGGKPGQGYSACMGNFGVRRLTVRECERLMGFPDDYTAIPGAADGPRYRALGNSFAVPVVRWIGERIQMLEKIVPLK